MLIQLPDFSWEVVEQCVPYFTKINYEEEIMECNGKPCMVLTMLHKKEEPLSTLGALHDEASVEASGADADASNFAFQPEVRSEERRVGKECRSRWSPYH